MIVLILLLAQDPPKPAPQYATGCWASAIKEHPRLLGPRAHLRALAKAKAPAYREIQAREDLPSAAIIHAVDGLAREKIRPHLGKGRMIGRSLLPSSIRKVEGYSYGGKTFEPPKTVHGDFAAKWRIEVTPTEARTEDTFLHVLFTDEPKPVKLVGKTGVRVGDVEVVFEGKVGGRMTIAGKKVPLEEKIKP